METTATSETLLTVLQILVPVAFLAIGVVGVVIALRRGERARSENDERITRARTRRAYLRFLCWGAFILISGVVVFGTAGRPFHVRQGWAMLVAFFLGIPAVIALLIGIFQALMVWRVGLVRLLLLATGVALSLFFVGEFSSTPLVGGPWSDAVICGYGLLVVGVSVRGLLKVRAGTAAS